ncbi:MAG: PQQ-binding-like beta-propeller repeat protein [Mariniphaga sp.]
MGRYWVVFTAFIMVFSACSAVGDEPSQWRGPNRAGIYYEPGLLDTWPEGGPELLWSYEGLGAGHTSAVHGFGRIFTTGMPDTLGVLYCFDQQGSLLWQKTYGTEWHVNYTGPRSTPVIAGDRVYLESGMGVVYCFDALSGDILWEVDLLKRFDAENIQWGMTETLLIDGDNIICTPGGKKHNLAALNRFTGQTVWTSPGYGEPAAYCSPILVEHNNTRLVVTMTASSIVGVDAGTGEMYWRAEQMQRNKIHANSPVYADGVIYCSSASAPRSSGTLALRLSDDGKQVEQLWRNESLQNLMGGIVLLDGFIFGSTYRSDNCMLSTFRTVKHTSWQKILKMGSLCMLMACFTFTMKTAKWPWCRWIMIRLKSGAGFLSHWVPTSTGRILLSTIKNCTSGMAMH